MLFMKKALDIRFVGNNHSTNNEMHSLAAS